MSFYEPLGDDRYRATGHAAGPWDARSQHGGPPAALLARAVERTSPAWPATVTRLTVDLLGPVPMAEVSVRSRVLRPGRNVELVEAELEASGRTVVRAQAWRIRRAELDLPDGVGDTVEAVPTFPATAAPLRPGWSGGFLDAVEWRPVGRGPANGPAAIWGRQRVPLLPDEEPTGLQRVMAVADCGNGASSVLPMDRWLFINTELTVHLAAAPSGEWICLDARTRIDRNGSGLATSRLFDGERLVAHGAQALYVAPR